MNVNGGDDFEAELLASNCIAGAGAGAEAELVNTNAFEGESFPEPTAAAAGAEGGAIIDDATPTARPPNLNATGDAAAARKEEDGEGGGEA